MVGNLLCHEAESVRSSTKGEKGKKQEYTRNNKRARDRIIIPEIYEWRWWLCDDDYNIISRIAIIH